MARTRRRAVDLDDDVPEQPTIGIEMVDIADLIPYDNNPRDNDEAVQSVANSIRDFGFCNPIQIDGGNVIVAGHTRRLASIQLGLTVVPCIRLSNLTETQAQALRLADNKTGERATWNQDMLAEEVQGLIEAGVDLTDYGYYQEEIDCLGDIVADDCLSATGFMDEDDRNRAGRADPRAPAQARVVISEFVFFLPMAAYTRWAREVRATNEFDEDDIIADLQERLGMTEYIEAET